MILTKFCLISSRLWPKSFASRNYHSYLPDRQTHRHSDTRIPIHIWAGEIFLCLFLIPFTSLCLLRSLCSWRMKIYFTKPDSHNFLYIRGFPKSNLSEAIKCKVFENFKTGKSNLRRWSRMEWYTIFVYCNEIDLRLTLKISYLKYCLWVQDFFLIGFNSLKMSFEKLFLFDYSLLPVLHLKQ